jgi:hypothetical protein
MDSTRRVLRAFVIVIAVGLGAIIAVPLALVLAGALYLRVAAVGVMGCIRLLGFACTQADVTPAKAESPANRLAS